jgi:transcriptional regulator with XRE-family HTH domain
MELMLGATVGEKIRYYRQQAGMTQRQLAELCEISEPAIRNYELGNRMPDYDTLQVIADALRVGYYAIADINLSDINGVMQTLFVLETYCGLCPKEVDGEIHLVFRNSLPVEVSAQDVDLETLDFGKLLQFRLRDFLKVCEQHNAGAMSDEQYALWKSKYPLYLSDCGGEKVIAKASETPAAEQQRPKKKRKRKINNGK